MSTTTDNKRIARNTILLYVRSVLLLIINLYISRLGLKALGVTDYGIYQVVGGVVSIFSILSSTMTSASQRFITYALGSGDKENLHKTFSACVSIHVILAIIVFFLLETIGTWFLYNKLNIPIERMTTAMWVMQFSIATFFINVVSVPYNAAIISHERMTAFAYITLLEGLLRLAGVVSLIWISGDKLFLYALYFFLAALVIRITYSVYCYQRFDETRNIVLKVDRPLFKRMFSFAGWNMIGNGAMILRNQGIDILLNIFFGVAVNAAKGICNQVQAAVMQLVGNFTVSVTPQLTKAVAKNDYERAHSLMFHGSKLAFFLMMIIAIPFISCCHEVLEIWLGEVPEYATEMVQLTFVYMLSDAMSRFLINAILAFGDIKWFQITNGGIKLLALPLTFLFLKLGGSPLTGIFINILLEFICVGGRLYFNRLQINFDIWHFVLWVWLRCWLLFVVAFAVIQLFYFNICDNLFVVSGFSLLSSSLLIWLLGLDKSEKRILIDYSIKLCQKLKTK